MLFEGSVFRFCKLHDFCSLYYVLELMKEGARVILEGKNIQLSHVNHVSNSINESNSVTMVWVINVIV